ncbi:MAG: hypothetical protein AAGG75_12250 [Bacteroidota bacterium]
MMSTQCRCRHWSKGLFLAILFLYLSQTPMTAQELHSSPSCQADEQLYTLAWGPGSDQYDWIPAGSLSQQYLNVNQSGHTFRISYLGSTADLINLSSGASPSLTSFFSDGSVNVLGQAADVASGSVNPIDIQIDIFPPIPARLGFDLYHINTSLQSGDRLTISASYKSGSALYPNLSANASPSWQQTAPGTVNPVNSTVSGNNDQVGVNFDDNGLIDQILIRWEGCEGCTAGDRGFGLGPISFCSIGPDRDADGIPDAEDIDDDNDGLPDPFEVCRNAPFAGRPDSSWVNLRLQLDDFPEETSWTLKDSLGNLVASGGPYRRFQDRGVFVDVSYYLPLGPYSFEIVDGFFNGICCTYGPGYYEILVDNQSIIGGPGNGSFGVGKTEQFNTRDVPYSAFYCLGRDPLDDEDNDGIPNYQDADYCTLNALGVCADMDTDSDGVPDFFDLDSDNDGLPDLVEAGGTDADGDGRIDVSTDVDGDGLADLVDDNLTDGPLIAGMCSFFPNCLFETSPSTLLSNAVHPLAFVDLDADDDGLCDVFEAKGADTDGDGLLDGSYFGANGYNDTVDPTEGGRPLQFDFAGDTDGDEVPDFRDVDADDDGLLDNYEAQPTATYTAPGTLDSDGDGLLDAYDDRVGFGGKGIDVDNSSASVDAYDHDGDGLPDYLDKDSDDDNISDQQEAWDSWIDGDSKADYPGDCSGLDQDGDGLRPCYDADDGDAANYRWAASPADDNGSTDGGLTASSGQLFASGSSLDLLLPDNGGAASEPDVRDVLIDCSQPRTYYALSEQSATTTTNYTFDPLTGQHSDGGTSGRIRATASCHPAGDDWYYFYNPLEPENYLFSIRYSTGSPDSFPLNELIDYIEIQLTPTPADRYQEDASSATLVMARDWQVQLKALPQAGSRFDIKFYFRPEELQALDAQADALLMTYPDAVRSSLQWFKKTGGLGVGDISPAGVEGMEDITSLATEVFDEETGRSENGAAASTDGSASEAGNARNYVEFRGLDSFSGGTALLRLDFNALPVELTTFAGLAKGCDVQLDWVTAVEDQFSHFELERSEDGQTFEFIKQTQGRGANGTAAYHYFDEEAGQLNYYRLKLVDLDGSFKYSNIIAVETPCAQAAVGLELYPNPLSPQAPQLKVKLRSHRPQATLIVMDVLGHQLLRKRVPVQKGWNAMTLDLSGFAPGMYYLLHLEGKAELAQPIIVTE